MKQALSGSDLPVKFEADQIRLDIPYKEGIIVKEGWRLSSLNPPVVSTIG